jgi:HEAT repeat protein
VPLDGPVAGRLAMDPDAAVRAEVAIAIVEAGGEEPAHTLLASLIEGPTPSERIAGLEAVARLRGHAPSPLIREALADGMPEVRCAAVRAIAVVDPPLEDPLPALLGALEDDARSVRLASAAALGGRGPEICGPLLEVLRTGSDGAQEAALLALGPQAGSVRGDVATWALGEVGRAARLRRQRFALQALETGGNSSGGGPSSPKGNDLASDCVGYLGFVLGRREQGIEERLVLGLAVLGAPDAGGVVRRSLAADDAETRAIAMETLDSIGDRRVARALVGLLESDPETGAGRQDAVLRELAGDDDPWTRTLAERAMAARGGTMPDVAEALSEVERMLVLRRVALFGALAPEDLQRVAASASERLWEPGEALVREGDPGDELIAIVEGTVRVVHHEGDAERFVRTYGPGDHIGELAVLREQRRIATVIAEPPGVRGLAIAGSGLKAILRERPEAAMAMLATLAERIATQ